jgi:cob(I)alamin adenosyltransferase
VDSYILNYGFIDMDEIVACIQNRREDLHVIVSGRDAPKAIIEIADLVTEMREIKHPFNPFL